MIDKIEVRIPEFALPGPALLQPMKQLKENYVIPPFRSGKYYQYSADLTDAGIEAIVHVNCRFGRHTHKVEILRTGRKTIWEMADILRALFDVDPMVLELMRVDLTADIDDVPVSWFRDNAYVSRKQYSSRIEKSGEQEMQFIAMSAGTAETIYAGKRPVVIRIYNKFGELWVKFRRLESENKRFNARMEGMDLSPEDKHYGMRISPTWEKFCLDQGHVYKEGGILTRVESQIGGTKRLPHGLKTFGDLRYADEIEPFKGMRFAVANPVLNVDAPPHGVSARNWLAILGFEQLVRAHGLQASRAIVQKYGQGNGSRILESLSESSQSSRAPVTLEELQCVYRASTQKQITPKSRGGLYVPYACDEFEAISTPYEISTESSIAIGRSDA